MNRDRSGPWLARQLLRLLVPSDDRAFVTGDLDECFRVRVSRVGRGSARAWYWWQVIRAVPARAATVARSGLELLAPGPAGWWGDLRHAFRSNLRRPSYALSVVVTLGLGLGGGAAILAVADGVWFKPLPFHRPHELVKIYEVDRSPVQGSVAGEVMFGATPSDRFSRLSPPLMEDLRAAEFQSVTGVAAMAGAALEWSESGRSERLRSSLVPDDITEVLGVRLLLGGGFSPGAREEVILNYGFWQQAFGGDRTVIGRSMLLNGAGYRIVGVLPEDLPYLSDTPLWSPLVFEESDLTEGMRGARYLDVIGRVAPGYSIAAAAAELDAFVSNLGADHPNHRGWGAAAVELRLDLVQPYRKVILVLLSAAGVFLLITLANVSGLAAARHAEGARERSIRAALGARSRLLLRRTVAEGILLGLAGALLAGALAYWSLGPLTRLAPQDVPRLDYVALDGRVALALIATALAVGALANVMGHLMAGTRIVSVLQGLSAQRQRHRGRTVLLVSQISLITMLLAGGAMLLGYFRSLAEADLGFEPEGVSTAMVVLDATQYQDKDRRRQFYQAVEDRLTSRGFEAAVGTNPPVAGSTMRFGYRVPGSEEQHWAQYHTVTPDYFSILGIPLREGRAFTDGDAGGEPVVIINDVIAREHFPSGNAVGRLVTVVSQQRRVVGVVGASHHFGPDKSPPAELYVPLEQDPWLLGNVLIAGSAVPNDILTDIIAEIDPATKAPAVEPFRSYLITWFAPLRFQLVVIGVLSLVGTALGAVGLYGLISFIVSRRTREIGIRVALGAGRGAVAWDVVRNGLTIAAAGVLIGTVGALASRKVFEGLVAGLDVGAVEGYLLVATVLGLVTVLACARPAYRASSVQPMEALREE